MPAVVLYHDLLYRDGERMTLIALQGGKVVMYGDKVGTEQECCCSAVCVCPDMQSLCISVSLTKFDGSTVTLDQDDFIWFGLSGVASAAEYTIFISCDVIDGEGGITVSGGWADVPEGCFCTSGSGSAYIPCSEQPDWYASTAGANIEYDDIGISCDGCPPTLGSFSVTISDPPC